ncbi:MAG: PKD domain-containing protein, partial [Solirubrobacterales bacterium]|nr:PKD domain-containing protein [Solirubrobacterales bacterium]
MRSEIARSHPVERRSGCRPRLILGRRLVVVLVLALTVSGWPAGTAAADDPAIVTATIYSSSGTTQTSASLSSSQADPRTCPEYSGPSPEQHGSHTTFTPNLPATTWAVSTILACLGHPIAARDVTAITIVNADGSPQASSGSQITPADIAAPSDFANTAEVPLIAYLGSTIEYYRPWRGGTDLNANDAVAQQNASPVTIEVFEGPSLSVTASASPATITPGATVSFSAAVSPSDASGLSYVWNFDGGPPSSTQSGPRETFTQQRIYNVMVQVTDAAGGEGFATVAVTVGTQAQTHTPPTNQQPPAPPRAPNSTKNSSGTGNAGNGGNGSGRNGSGSGGGGNGSGSGARSGNGGHGDHA